MVAWMAQEGHEVGHYWRRTTRSGRLPVSAIRLSAGSPGRGRCCVWRARRAETVPSTPKRLLSHL